jgi:uncharacterized membrane protein YeiH
MTLFLIADVIGIAAFAVSGLLAGVRHRLDLLGLGIVASLTALGGGILRDVLLDRTPFAFSEFYPAMTVILSVAAALLLRLDRRQAIERKWVFVISDTVGLVAFSITGALLGIKADFNFFGVIIVSFLTAIGGGVTRDILINQVPSVLTGGFYGTVALIVALLLMLLHAYDTLNGYTLGAVALFGVALRLIAYRRGWEIPRLPDA